MTIVRVGCQCILLLASLGKKLQQFAMVKIGGAPTEERWNELTQEQVKSLVFEINLEVNKVVAEMEIKLELLTLKSEVHGWYNLAPSFLRRLNVLRECFPPYSAESYRYMEGLQHKNILKEFKEFNKRKNYQDRYLKLKAELLALERFLLEKTPVRKKHEETAKQLRELKTQIDSDREFLKEAKTSIKDITSAIVREKKAMQRDVTQMKRNNANAAHRLSKLRETLKQKEALLKETTEQRQKEEDELLRERQENKKLLQILNEHTAQLRLK